MLRVLIGQVNNPEDCLWMNKSAPGILMDDAEILECLSTAPRTACVAGECKFKDGRNWLRFHAPLSVGDFLAFLCADVQYNQRKTSGKEIANINSCYAFPRPMPREKKIWINFSLRDFIILRNLFNFVQESFPCSSLADVHIFIQAVGGAMNQRRFRNARILYDCEIVCSWTWATYLGWETAGESENLTLSPAACSRRRMIINISPLTQKATSSSEIDFHTITHEIHVIAYIFSAPFPRPRHKVLT